ncbi:hypothetical protein [Streptomyces sp. HSG2]|uniref:hypothetical protein n=1 Tax=Streptomyces sp. HSG2 TaxID=2797167 RepID=UPI001F5B3799|nr:hypothetical protein [Streptomyces sp. HSG2]
MRSTETDATAGAPTRVGRAEPAPASAARSVASGRTRHATGPGEAQEAGAVSRADHAAPGGPTPGDTGRVVPGPDAARDVIPGAGPTGRHGPPEGGRESREATGRAADEHGTWRPPAGEPADPPRYAPEWLRLREPADADARSRELLGPLRRRLAEMPSDGLVVHDLGCGTGSMGRWLAPLIDGAQRWILHDRDPYLLHFAAADAPRRAADGGPVTVETRRGDLARLTPDALRGASLVTASALLDVVTAEEADALAAAVVGAGCPALLTLSVAGRVALDPEHPLDAELAEAFDSHQRRDGLLGPEATDSAAEAFERRGATVLTRPSPWRLGPEEAALTAQWLRGWVGAAVEERPGLRGAAERYLAERLAACAAGHLRVVVHHRDLLALCPTRGGAG